jgi:DNA-binding CsgD family transcriptional regulator
MWDTSRVGSRLSNAALVGRALELERLDDTFAALPETGAATVLISGDAGIGKSRLIQEFCQRARTSGALVAVGLCTPGDGGGLPYGPVIGAVRDASRQLGTADVEASLGRVRDLLGLVSPPAEQGVSGLLKTSLFESLLQGVARLAESRPVVLVFEDLQWADSVSVQVIDFLTRNLVDRPVMLIASFRTDEIEQDRPLRRLVSELSRHGRAYDLELAGLERDETAHLLAAILSAPPDWALVDAVHARSGGNPFFAEELAAARHAPSLPPSLRNVLMMRIERLSKAARHAVDVAAANGGAVHHRLLSAALQLGPDQADAALAEAVDHQVVVADAADGRFRFRHALLREAVYDALLPGERSRLHRRLAVALSSSAELAELNGNHGIFDLADHWWEAGDWGEAFQACVRAADVAAAMLATHEAHFYFERALTSAVRWRTDAVPVELLLKASDAAYLDGETSRSIELARQAVEIVDADAEPRLAARCYTMLARNAWAGGKTDVALDSLRRGAAASSSTEPTVELAGILAEEARILMLTSHYEVAEEKCKQAMAVARATGARIEECHTLITLGCCVADRGDVDRGLALLRQGRDIAEELASPDQLCRAYGNIGHVLMQASRLTEAADLVFNGAADLSEVNGVRLNNAGQNAAEALIRLGCLVEADEVLCRMDYRGSGSCVFGPNGVRAIMAIRGGRFDEASKFLSAAEELSAGVSTVQVAGQLRRLHAELFLERGEPAAAVAEIERALTVAAGTDDADYTLEIFAIGLRAVVDEQEQARARGRRMDVEKVHRRVAEMLEGADAVVGRRRTRHHPCSPRMLAFLAQCHAEAARLGSLDPELWRAAAEKWAVAGEPYPRAYCRWREAEALLSGRGERRRAVACVQEAWRTAAKLDAPTLQSRLERLAARARIPLDVQLNDGKSSTVAEDLGLTAREVEVLAQLARGRTDRQIAEELFISRKTASVHVSNLLRKLDAGSRVEAGEIGQRAGLVG